MRHVTAGLNVAIDVSIFVGDSEPAGGTVRVFLIITPPTWHTYQFTLFCFTRHTLRAQSDQACLLFLYFFDIYIFLFYPVVLFFCNLGTLIWNQPDRCCVTFSLIILTPPHRNLGSSLIIPWAEFMNCYQSCLRDIISSSAEVTLTMFYHTWAGLCWISECSVSVAAENLWLDSFAVHFSNTTSEQCRMF